MTRTVERKVKPVSPAQVKAVEKVIPNAVLEVFNQQIKTRFDGHSAVVLQKDVLAALETQGFKPREIFDNSWLDVEPSYEKQGWEVYYDQPVQSEDPFEAFFKFTPRQKI
jgi:hypothetical protein